MSKARFSILAASALVLVLSTCARARDPNVPFEPNAPGRTRTVETRPAPRRPIVSPQRPAVRRPALFTREMPLSQAIDILRNATRPPLNIVVLWRDLDNAGIYRDTAIGIDGAPGLRIRQYLDLLVLSLSAGAPVKFDWVVHGNVVTIGTVDALPAAKLVTRVYDISDLVAPPARYSLPSMGFGGMGSYGGGMFGGQMPGMGSYGGGMGGGLGFGSSYMSGTGGLGGFGNQYGGVGSTPMPYGR